MPELPEVEAGRKLLARVLVGRRITLADIPEDPILLSKNPAQPVIDRLQDGVVESIGRKGKFWWIAVRDRGIVGGHLGMTGGLLDLTPGREEAVHYKLSQAQTSLVDGRPKWCKFWLETEDGGVASLVDPRRLARLWLADSPETDPRLTQLGPDAYLELPESEAWIKSLTKRKTAIKALLLNQSFLAGIGNYLADEVLYQARINPARLANSLTVEEAEELRVQIQNVVGLAVRVNADYDHFPSDWIFHYRWGSKKGASEINGHAIERVEVGGRTTAWAPSLQR